MRFAELCIYRRLSFSFERIGAERSGAARRGAARNDNLAINATNLQSELVAYRNSVGSPNIRGNRREREALYFTADRHYAAIEFLKKFQ